MTRPRSPSCPATGTTWTAIEYLQTGALRTSAEVKAAFADGDAARAALPAQAGAPMAAAGAPQLSPQAFQALMTSIGAVPQQPREPLAEGADASLAHCPRSWSGRTSLTPGSTLRLSTLPAGSSTVIA